MKQKAVVLTLVFAFLGIFSCYGFSGENMSRNENLLPKEAKAFLKKHFPNEKVSYVLVDKEIFQTTYEVMLTSGKKVEFYKSGEWKEVDAQRAAVPSGIVPADILKHVKEHFGDEVYIVQIEKSFRTITVELSNKLEVKFTSEGKFLRYDD